MSPNFTVVKHLSGLTKFNRRDSDIGSVTFQTVTKVNRYFGRTGNISPIKRIRKVNNRADSAIIYEMQGNANSSVSNK